MTREEIRLRKDVLWLFEKNSLEIKDLIFWDEVENKDLTQTKFILTDHNRMSEKQEKYSSQVIEILDHHKVLYNIKKG
jgi:inorganic pyrophosphatase/exopolyphosphatase